MVEKKIMSSIRLKAASVQADISQGLFCLEDVLYEINNLLEKRKQEISG